MKKKDDFPPTYEEVVSKTYSNPPTEATKLGRQTHVPSAPNLESETNSYNALENTPSSVEVPAPTVIPECTTDTEQRCPACQTGVLKDSYPCVALLCAIMLFPVGILCCLAMKNKRCPECETEF